VIKITLTRSAAQSDSDKRTSVIFIWLDMLLVVI